jgi:hypothetical protein
MFINSFLAKEILLLESNEQVLKHLFFFLLLKLI